MVFHHALSEKHIYNGRPCQGTKNKYGGLTQEVAVNQNCYEIYLWFQSQNRRFRVRVFHTNKHHTYNGQQRPTSIKQDGGPKLEVVISQQSFKIAE
jgi:hypothetical protein